MSIIFGLLKERNETVSESELLRASVVTECYATGPGHTYVKGRLGMGLQPYFSHQRSEFELRPLADSHRRVVSFDGRLDNYKELITELALSNADQLDSRIVLAAFDRWGEECFSRLVGDWALALWSEGDQSLYLARDHAGARTLYVRQEHGALHWSTHLDTFGAFGTELCLADEYVARYLAFVPMREVTPYKGVSSVLPGHYATFRNGAISCRAHWNAIVRTTTRHKSDEEYEAHFLSLFQQSVERRTGPGAPILAQLSGGMDSTSIVCMSSSRSKTHEFKINALVKALAESHRQFKDPIVGSQDDDVARRVQYRRANLTVVKVLLHRDTYLLGKRSVDKIRDVVPNMLAVYNHGSNLLFGVRFTVLS